MQLVYQGQKNVQLADGTQASRHFAKPALELAGGVMVELKHWQQFPEPARRDPCPVDRAYVTFFDPG
jgi:hypothetical protein